MRMLWCSILSAVLLVSLAQASPLKKSVENGTDGVKSSDSAKNGYPLPGNVTPGSYTIKLEPHLDDKNFTFNGESNIKFTFYSWGGTMKTIVLHAVDLEIEKEFTSLVSMDGKTTLKPTTQSLDTLKEFFTIGFTPPIKTDYYTLNLRYTGKLKEDPKGLYRVRRQIDGHDVWEALTQFKPSYARRAFPCFDETGMKAYFNISIKRPKNYEVRSTTLQAMSYDDRDKSWTQFRSTYLSPDQIDFKVVCDLNCSRWYESTTDAPPSTTDEPPSTTDEPPSTTDEPPSTTEMAESTMNPPTNPPTNQKCIHANYLFTCTQCRPLINISLS